MTESPKAPCSDLQELLVHAQTLLPSELRLVVDVVPLYQALTDVWAQQPAAPGVRPAQGLVWAQQLHLCNFHLWRVEDSVRRPGASESFIAQSKRAIDTLNQQRHDQIEQLDAWLFAYLYEHNSTPCGDRTALGNAWESPRSPVYSDAESVLYGP